MLISDIARSGDANAGLNDLEAMRADGTFTGPAIFYTARVTPSRQRSAEALGARITTTPDVLLEYLRTRWDGMVPDPPTPGSAAQLPPGPPHRDTAWPIRKTRDKANSWLTGEL